MNLVLQGAPLTRDALSQLVALTGANHVVTLEPTAWRLTGVFERHEIESFCAQHGLDFAWVPDERRLADLRLLALDMDSTLITIETLDELGDVLDIGPRIAQITQAAMRGEIDYAESLHRRVGHLAGLEEAALEHVLEKRLRLSEGAERLFVRCREQGIRTLLVSGGFTFFTHWLQERLGIDYTLSNVLEINNGRLTGRLVGDIVDAAAKAAMLRRVMRELDASAAQTLAVGDGANDVPMMKAAGVSVAYRAKPVVREHATHALEYTGLDGVLNLFI